MRQHNLECCDTKYIHAYCGHTARIWGVDWSPFGNHIASCGIDSTVQIWDAASASHIYTYFGHSSTVWSALWSPNGQLIASVSNDGTHRYGEQYKFLCIILAPSGTLLLSEML